MTWLVRVPFSLAPGRSIGEGQMRAGNREWELKRNGEWHVLITRGIADEKEARDLVPRVVASLVWAGVGASMGIDATDAIRKLELRNTPAPPESLVPGAYGFENEGAPSVYPDDKKVAFAAVGTPTLLVSTPAELFGARFSDAFEMPQIDRLINDSRLRLAVDVFASGFSDTSQYAAFLSCITVLEVLKDQGPQPQPIAALVDQAHTQAESLKRDGAIEGRLADSFLGSLQWLRRRSIGLSIYDLVEPIFGHEKARRTKEIYDLRSRAVHGEMAAVREAEERLAEIRDLVLELLTAILQR